MSFDEGSVMSLPDSPVEPEDVEPTEDGLAPTVEPVSIEQASLTVSKLLKGKGRERDEDSQRKRPLNLLELPADILRLIVKEITHTNDLTALALANSTLHSFAIPHIYARFDIVWPDAHMTASDTKSVDALTYGLSTLSLGSSFSRIRQRLFRQGSMRGENRPPLNGNGNSYAAHTRKFSLGNGPQDWVAEYMITKESGKMLGTLVAMAVAKMQNLETFVWDMPTGVLAEIFLALASLPDYHEDGDCNLDRVWIRWHDNSDTGGQSTSTASSPVTPQQSIVPMGSTLTPIGIQIPASATHPKPRKALPYSSSNVEYPTFSVLPPLRSLTVLDIDEIAYLDEIAMLIERSQDRLQELRVGISSRAVHKDFVQAWDGPDLQQVDHNAHWPGASSIGDRRLGGVLGTLVGRIYDIRRKVGPKPKDKAPSGSTTGLTVDTTVGVGAIVGSQTPTPSAVIAGGGEGDQIPQLEPISSTTQTVSLTNGDSASPSPLPDDDDDLDQFTLDDGTKGNITTGTGSLVDSSPAEGVGKHEPHQALSKKETEKGKSKKKGNEKETSHAEEAPGRKRLEGKLKLQTLELERLPLSIQVCSKAIDWTTMTNLTILDCAQHETLWKLLRRQFQPTPVANTSLSISPSSRRNQEPANAQLQYHLNLKRIHTDNTSAALINFIKEVLAPNTLEVLFLQDRRKPPGPPSVTLDSIFRGAIKRHRLSLRKLLLDSSNKNVQTGTAAPENTRWRNWVLNTDILLYITSGRMRNLRELAVSLTYNDWHTFLQRLPNVPQLRSLNIPHIADHIISNFEPKELALQIADIITLRPEIQLCYVGISTKCFEILESTPGERGPGSSAVNGDNGNGSSGNNNNTHASGANGGTGAAALGNGHNSDNDSLVEGESDDGHQSDTSEESGGEDTEDDEGGAASNATDPDETQSEGHSDGGPDSDDDDFVDPDLAATHTKLRLREILFYDDKVAIFKARHGKL